MTSSPPYSFRAGRRSGSHTGESRSVFCIYFYFTLSPWEVAQARVSSHRLIQLRPISQLCPSILFPLPIRTMRQVAACIIGMTWVKYRDIEPRTFCLVHGTPTCAQHQLHLSLNSPLTYLAPHKPAFTANHFHIVSACNFGFTTIISICHKCFHYHCPQC